ncbi:MAG: hypothetical protein LBH48_03885 [Bifidobacteriaceae bacterium]|nr:hypothetical protein [Bifidobacteriaceae bacterium]
MFPEESFAIQVQADDGQVGYVWKRELNEAEDAFATSPAEIASLMAQREAAQLPTFQATVAEGLGGPPSLSDEQWRELLQLAYQAGGEGVIGEDFDEKGALAAACGLLGVPPRVSDPACPNVATVLAASISEARQVSGGRLRVYETDGKTALGWFSGVGG